MTVSWIKRYCKTLDLYPDPELIRQYKAVHAKGAAWPEITQGMQDVGIRDMEIYLYNTRLFMIMDTGSVFDHEKDMAALAHKPRQAEWESYVSKFQRTTLDSSAAQKWVLLERIYEMDQEKQYAPEDGQLKIAGRPHLRFCKTLLLKPDPELISEYKKVHGIGVAWTEITQGMKEVGITDMEIYIHNNRLFMIMDTRTGFDHDKAMAELAKKPRQKEWETYVARFQKTSAGASAGEKWQMMDRIFKINE